MNGVCLFYNYDIKQKAGPNHLFEDMFSMLSDSMKKILYVVLNTSFLNLKLLHLKELYSTVLSNDCKVVIR